MNQAYTGPEVPKGGDFAGFIKTSVSNFIVLASHLYKYSPRLMRLHEKKRSV